jgi:tetratricopeptide (TPR) repeat protein
MPIKILTSAEAYDNNKDPAAKWPTNERLQAERLLPIAKPEFRANFQIGREDVIFTIGSCFARNIEKQLAIEGYEYASKDFDIPAEESDFPTDISSILNKYVVFSVLNELKWALVPGESFPDNAYVEIRNGKYIDPHMNHAVTPSILERCKNRRRYVHDFMVKAAKADVFIMTLGLAEAWYDSKTELYLNIMPHRSARDREPDRFQFHVLDYNDILQCLEDIYSLLRTYGNPDIKVLLTVSPVALSATFSGNDVLVANSYSKSVQRAAVEAFVQRHDGVDYFPSYESVTLSDRRRAWRDDQAHASDEIVRYNVLKMMGAYMGGEHPSADSRSDNFADAFELVRQANATDKAGNKADAMRLFRRAYELAPHEGILLLEYANFLFRNNQFDDAVRIAKESTVHSSGPYSGFYFLAQFARAAGQIEEAHAAVKRAREFEPVRPGVLHMHGIISTRMKLYDEGAEVFETLLTLNPGFEAGKIDYLRMAEEAGDIARAQAFIDKLVIPENIEIV